MRKRKPKLRVIAPDPRYGDPMVTQFVNMMMLQGKKSVAFKVFYDAMDIIKERILKDHIRNVYHTGIHTSHLFRTTVKNFCRCGAICLSRLCKVKGEVRVGLTLLSPTCLAA